MSQLDQKTLTDDELRKHLITSDYLGKEWKEKCLDELLVRLAIDIAKAKPKASDLFEQEIHGYNK
jgi:hypothetical protein